MKEAINYFYNIYPSKIEDIDNGVYFYYHDFKYYFIKYDRDVKEIDLLVKISNDLYSKNIYINTFILSNKNTFYVNFNNDVYVLVRVNSDEDYELNLKDVVKFNNLLISNDLFMNEDWATLWSKKIDEFETEMTDLNNDYPIIQESSHYYIGLAENAISYFRDTLIEEDIKTVKINLNHKRVGSKVYSGVLYNPLTFTFDYDVRDISEYIKSKFFASNLDYFEIEEILNNYQFSKCSLRFLFSRLLYPSYYFDLAYKVLNDDYDENKIDILLSRIQEYEDFLMDIYNIINRKVHIPPVQWIMNKS